MTVLPFILSRVLWGAFSYLLAIAGFLARVADRYIGPLRLDLGTSRTMRTAGPRGSNRVVDLVAEALPSTLVLFVTATAVSTAVGLAIGLRMSRRPGGAADQPCFATRRWIACIAPRW